MSINKYKPHLFILPEDDANREIANGFINNPKVNERVIHILPIADGWAKAVEQLANDHITGIRQFPQRRIVLLIDFDQRDNRLSHIQSQIPEEIKTRVFVLGVKSNPENLRKNTQSTFETIGDILAQNCADNTDDLWSHNLLRHNQTELERLRQEVRPFLFG